MITKKMMTNLNVLRLRGLYWGVSDLGGTRIVTGEWHSLQDDAAVLAR